MKSIYLLILSWSICALAQASDDSLTLFRDGLFAEESEQDFATAKQKYTTLLERFEKEQSIAASALFRLAEISRKEGKDEEAAELYRRLAVTFPNVEPQARMSRQNLIAMGEPLPESGSKTPPPTVEESIIEELEELRIDSPDLFSASSNLDSAASEGWLEVMAYLVEHGIDVNVGSALLEAAAAGHLSACEFLLDHGCDPTKGANANALKAAWVNGYRSITKLLLEHGPGVKGEHGNWIVTAMDGKGQIDQVKLIDQLGLMIDAGFNINTADSTGAMPSGETLLHRMARYGLSDVVSFLIKQGAEIDPTNNTSAQTPLHLACDRGHQQVVELLIKAGANVSAITNKAEQAGFRSEASPMSLAIQQQHLNIVVLLLDAGADFPSEQFVEYAELGNMKWLTTLVKHGVDPNSKPNNGKSALYHALNRDRNEAATLLFNSGATLGDKSWQRANAEMRQTLMIKQRYPEFAKRKGVTFVLPEILWDVELAGTKLDRTSLYHALLATALPHEIIGSQNRVPDTSRKRWSVNRVTHPNNVVLHRVRNGERSKISADGEINNFQPGDVIELTGFFLPESRWKVVTTKVFENADHSPITNELREALTGK